MKSISLISCLWAGLVFFCYSARAQNENNVWAFGDSTGLDFNSGAPTVVKTSILSWESGASVSNIAGRLLFYCGRYNPSYLHKNVTLWDSTHNMMPNGDSLIGNRYTSSSQGVAIQPFLDGSNRYFVFTQAARENLWEDKDHYLRYSVVDMGLRGGLGDVVSGYKNMIIDSFVSEKLFITQGDGCAVWLLTHRLDTNVFHAFKIDYSGIHLIPIISGFPSDRFFNPMLTPPESPYSTGNMDVSTDGSHIAMSRSGKPALTEIYDFDKSTGIVSNQRAIDSIFNYWVQFSPDGTKLYTTAPIAQYDLTLLPSLSAVKASRTIIRDSSSSWAGMRIGPDNKIYTIVNTVTSSSSIEEFIYRIDSPNLKAPSCSLTRVLKLPSSKESYGGLGPNVVIPPPSDTLLRRRDTALCFSPSGKIVADSGYSYYVWDDGTSGRIKHVPAPGKSWVRMRKACTIFVDTFYCVTKTLDTLIQKIDTTICFSKPVSISAGLGRAYRWYDNDTNRVKTFSAAGIYWVKYFSSECALTIDTFNITDPKKFDTSFNRIDTIVCFMRPVVLKARPGFEHVKWYSGSTAMTQTISTAGVYWVAHFNNCKMSIDSFYVVAQQNDSTFFRTDTTVCLQNSIRLYAPVEHTDYLWSDGTIGQFKEIRTPGLYWVYSYNRDCKTRVDTFNVIAQQNDSTFFKTDTSVCQQNSVVIFAPVEHTHYSWSDGSISRLKEIRTSGTYWVYSYNRDCNTRVDTFNVRFVQFDLPLPPTDSVCNNDTITLDASTLNAQYLWQDGSTNAMFRTGDAGRYYVRISVDGCSLTDTIEVLKKELKFTLGNDQNTCEGATIVLNPQIESARYLWQDGSTDQIFNVSQSGEYSVTVSKDNCVASDTIKIDIVRCSNCIALPNAFTPNADNKNDFFRPIFNCPTAQYSLKIFNRYGQEIFTTDNPMDKWEGKINGRDAELGVYYYLLKVTFAIPNAKEEMYKGDISLLR